MAISCDVTATAAGGRPWLTRTVLALLVAAVSLALSAGPVAAAERSSASLVPLGEASLETLPGLQTGAPFEVAWAGARQQAADPRWAAGLALAVPAAMALPSTVGVWLPAIAAPLGLAAGHLYLGQAERAAGYALGGVGAATLGGVGAYWLAGQFSGASPLTAWAGFGLGVASVATLAALDAYRLAQAPDSPEAAQGPTLAARRR
ncbi:MAG: hypothetical protein VKP62_01895 [Candidatus Sericytochromatia bacterium]|nr:hypothetical protein [Candidatus Sericytochromatia bacterium]